MREEKWLQTFLPISSRVIKWPRMKFIE
jgi:hypothetical protein